MVRMASSKSRFHCSLSASKRLMPKQWGPQACFLLYRRIFTPLTLEMLAGNILSKYFPIFPPKKKLTFESKALWRWRCVRVFRILMLESFNNVRSPWSVPQAECLYSYLAFMTFPLGHLLRSGGYFAPVAPSVTAQGACSTIRKIPIYYGSLAETFVV